MNGHRLLHVAPTSDSQSSGPGELREFGGHFDERSEIYKACYAAADAWEADIVLLNSRIVANMDEVGRLRQRLEAAECPDVPTARALAVLIMTNKVPSPWRDTGTRLREIGLWLATLAGRPAQQVAEADAPVCPFCGSDHSGQFCPLAGEEKP